MERNFLHDHRAGFHFGAELAGIVAAIAGPPRTFHRLRHGAFRKNGLTTTLVTTVVWIIVTVFTAKEPDEILLSFYRKVRPQVTGWKPIAALAPEILPRTTCRAICGAGFSAA